MSNRVAVLVVVMFVAGVRPTAAAVSPAGRCSAGKLKATAVAARALARCHAEAAAAVDTACVDAALNPLYEAFTELETPGGCATHDDHASIRVVVNTAVVNVASLVHPSGVGADSCAGRKLRAVGTKLFAILRAHAAAVRGGSPDRFAAAIARAEDGFAKAFDRAGRKAACFTPSDAATVESILDGPIATLRGRLAPTCGDDIQAGSEACDGAQSVACPGRCLADCTCRPIVCGDGVREGNEACDGGDDAACPGQCQTDCRCPTGCGNGIVDGPNEQCDGSATNLCGLFEGCQSPGLSGECQCCSTGFCNGGYPFVCCGDARCVRNASSPVGVCTPFHCAQASDCGAGSYNCENGSCCAQPGRSCINIGCCAGSACSGATGVPLCCVPTGGPCTAFAPGACCSGSCTAGVCD